MSPEFVKQLEKEKADGDALKSKIVEIETVIKALNDEIDLALKEKVVNRELVDAKSQEVIENERNLKNLNKDLINHQREKNKMTWIPGNFKFGIALINDEFDLVGLGLYDSHHEAVKMHTPEVLEKKKINNFFDVLKHICNKEDVNDTDMFRVRNLVFKYNKEKMLEIGAHVERKLEGEEKWYMDIVQEKEDAKKLEEEAEEQRRKDEEEKKKAAGEEIPKVTKVEKKEKTKEELEEEKKEEEIKNQHWFFVDFVHENIARERRKEEIAERKAAKDKKKGDQKGGASGGKAAPAGKQQAPAAKKGGAEPPKKGDPKKDGKGKKGEAAEEEEALEVATMEIDLTKILKIRVDHAFGQCTKILFYYNNESVVVMELPTMSKENQELFLIKVEEEKARKAKQEEDRLIQEQKELEKKEKAETRKRILAKRNGEEYTPPPPEPETKEEGKKEEDMVIAQSYFYINNYKCIDGLWAHIEDEFKYFNFWGVEMKELLDEEAEKKKMEEEIEAEKKRLEEEKAALEVVDEKKDEEKLKDDFIKDVNLATMKLKLIFFIDFHNNTPPPLEKDEKEKKTNSINHKKFKNDTYETNFTKISTFIKEILPNCEIFPNHKHQKEKLIGLFKVYTYGFGEHPLNEFVFFSNKESKDPFPHPKTIYYDLIDELIKYDDLHKLVQRQRSSLERINIHIPIDDSKDAKKTEEGTDR